MHNPTGKRLREHAPTARDRTKDFRPDTERDLLGGLISAETRYSADRIISAERVNFGRYYPKGTKFWPKLTIKVSYFGRYTLFRPKFLYRSFRLSGRYLSGASEVISIGRKPKESSFVRSLVFSTTQHQKKSIENSIEESIEISISLLNCRPGWRGRRARRASGSR